MQICSSAWSSPKDLETNLRFQADTTFSNCSNFSMLALVELLLPERVFSTCTYGEVHPIFMGMNVAERGIFKFKLAEIMATTFFRHKE